MLKETFFLDGVDAASVGIHLQNPMEFSEPVPIVEIESIPGRNGDLIFETGAFENRTGSAECFAMMHNNVELTIRAINRFLLFRKGYRKLETTDDPEHYWMARVENGARIEQRLRTMSPFEIEFDCKPQRFLKSGLETVEMTNGGVLYNQYGFDALPLIKVYGSGEGSLNVGNKRVEILSMTDGELMLDSETQNAYIYGMNRNNQINAPEFPVLTDGENNISWRGGIERVEIIPRWWEL